MMAARMFNFIAEKSNIWKGIMKRNSDGNRANGLLPPNQKINWNATSRNGSCI